MEVSDKIVITQQWLEQNRQAEKQIGFVPTMGALHQGHIELVSRAVKENDVTVCSIFVNPIQFNNPEDLEKYPRTLEQDLEMLEKAGCDLVFTPGPKEMYPEPARERYDFGLLERVMEGAFRPGHFNGVAVVVKRLFDIIRPGRAYFGLKDYQQLKIIQALVRQEKVPVEIIPCEIVREHDGLAMSSRNRRLNDAERALAPEIYRTLVLAKEKAGQIPVHDLEAFAIERLQSKGFTVEYFQVADAETLQSVDTWVKDRGIIACTAVFLGNVRLIDNIILFSNFAPPY